MEGFDLNLDHSGERMIDCVSITEERVNEFAIFAAPLIFKLKSNEIGTSHFLERIADYAQTPQEIVYFVHVGSLAIVA